MAKRPALGKGMGALLDSAVQAGRGETIWLGWGLMLPRVMVWE